MSDQRNIVAGVPPRAPATSVVVSGAQSRAALRAIFQQLSNALQVLSSSCDLVKQGRMSGPAAQPLRVWLQPNARQAEVALHRLREFRLTQSPAASELIQCLTVLVLAADMIVEGQLSDSGTLETYDLLRRNAERATRSLSELRAQVLPGVRGADEA